MKKILLFLFVYSICSPLFAQISSDEIEDASSLLYIQSEISIISVYNYPEGGSSGVVDYETGEIYKIGGSLAPEPDGDGTITIPINENYYLISSYLSRSEPDDEYVVFFYELGRGARKILSAKYNYPNFPRVNELEIISFINGVLTVHITYLMNPDDGTQRRIIQLSGDWESFGLKMEEKVGDLNYDGIINQLDLLLFIKEWKK